MKAFIYITLVASLSALSAQATVVRDNLAQELNADDIGAVTNGSEWKARTGAVATLNDTITGKLTKVATTENGGQNSSLLSNTLRAPYGMAEKLGATTDPITGTTVSIELWIKTGFTNYPIHSQTIFETGGSSKGMTITLGDNASVPGMNNTLRFAMKDTSNSVFVDLTLDAMAIANLTNGDHHQLVLTYDNANTILLYIDGVKVGQNMAAGVIDWDGTSGAGFWGRNGDMAHDLGLDSDGQGNGSIAVFRHYTDVLTAGEVEQNYLSTVNCL